MQKQFDCDSCDACFKIKHNLDETFFEVNFCPFCGAEVVGNFDDDEEDGDYE